LRLKEKEQTMKNQLKLEKVTARSSQSGSAMAALLLLGIATTSALGEVLPPSSLPYGLSYQEWSAKWWQWSLGQSTERMELVGGPGICEGPASQVRFLAGAYGFGVTAETNHVTIFAGTPLFLTVLGFVADNTACPTNNFTSLTGDQLAAEALSGWSGAANLTTCTIDGVPVAGIADPTNSVYNVVSPAFSYTTADRDNILSIVEGEDCIPGGLTIYPAVTDGVYLMLSPLSPGRHTIHWVGVAGPLSSPIVDDDVTFDITVLRDFDDFGR
jgi:hypothetical protein